jgi:hypothetical protein
VKTTVQRGYVVVGDRFERTLIDCHGRIYLEQNWIPVPPAARVVAEGMPYENWADVPRAWLGAVPFWSAR